VESLCRPTSSILTIVAARIRDSNLNDMGNLYYTQIIEQLMPNASLAFPSRTVSSIRRISIKLDSIVFYPYWIRMLYEQSKSSAGQDRRNTYTKPVTKHMLSVRNHLSAL